jgi:hypothetical protein
VNFRVHEHGSGRVAGQGRKTHRNYATVQKSNSYTCMYVCMHACMHVFVRLCKD